VGARNVQIIRLDIVNVIEFKLKMVILTSVNYMRKEDTLSMSKLMLVEGGH
jgi:hypothetical protein